MVMMHMYIYTHRGAHGYAYDWCEGRMAFIALKHMGAKRPEG